jgi:hypothetical protein
MFQTFLEKNHISSSAPPLAASGGGGMPATYAAGPASLRHRGRERAHLGGSARGRMADTCETAAPAARMAAGRTIVWVVAAQARVREARRRMRMFAQILKI